MTYPKSVIIIKSYNAYMMYMLSMIVCLLLSLHTFPDGMAAKVDAETKKKSTVIFSGHTDQVMSVAFSPDGTLLASGSLDGTIKLWNPTTGEQIKSKNHAPILAIAFSPDGQTLASAASDGTIKLWNPKLEEISTISGHDEQILSVAFSYDGMSLASSSWNGVIKIWNNIPDSQKWKELCTLKGYDKKGYESDVHSITFSPDGHWFAAGSTDKKIRLWNTEPWDIAYTLPEHTGRVFSVAFSLNSQRLASGSTDGTIRVWDMEKKEIIQTIICGEGNVYAVAFSPDGKLLASGTADGIINLWNPESGKAVYTFKRHESGVFSVAFHPNEQLLASGSQDKTLMLWRLLSIYIVDADSFPKTITTNRLSLEFAVEHLSSYVDGDILYSWQLLNDKEQLKDDKWPEPRPGNNVELRNLVDGEYTFQVKAINKERNIESLPAEVSFMVAAFPFPNTEIVNPTTEPIITRNVIIQFTGSDWQTPKENLKYSWRVDEEGWSTPKAFESNEKPYVCLDKLSDGWHLFEVKAFDEDGNEDPIPAQVSFQIRLLPETKITNAPEEKEVVKTADYTFGLQGSDVPEYKWRLGDNDWQETTDTFVTLRNLSDGEYTFEAKAINQDGSEDPTLERVSFKVEVEKSLPNTQITNALKEEEVVETTDYTFGLQGSDVPKYKWRLGDNDWQETTDTFVTLRNLSDGEYTFEAIAINQDEKEDPTPERVFFKVEVEKSLPNTQITNAPKEEEVVETTDYTFGLQGSDVPKYKYHYDDNDWQETTDTFVTLRNLSDGDYTFEAIAINQDEKEDPTPERVSFKVEVEKSLPNTQIANAPKKTVKTADYTFGLQGSDAPKYKWRLDDNDWQEATDTFITLRNLSDGDYTFEAIAINQDEKEDPTPERVSFKVEVEKSLPNTQITNAPKEEEVVKTTDYTFGIQGSDVPKYKYRYDDKEWQETTNTFITLEKLSDGKHIFEAYAINQDGSKDPTLERVSFKVEVEKSLPNTQITNAPKEEEVVETTDYTFGLQGSDVPKYRWWLDGKETRQGTTDGTFVTLENLSDGEYTFEAKAINQDGIEDPTPERVSFKVEVKKHLPDTQITNIPKEPVKTTDYTFGLQGSDVPKYEYHYDDKEWQETTETFVTLEKLSDGRHIFEAIAINKDGIEDPTSVKVEFYVDVPFYNKTFFLPIVFGFVFVIFVTAVLIVIIRYKGFQRDYSYLYEEIDKELLETGGASLEMIPSRQRQQVVNQYITKSEIDVIVESGFIKLRNIERFDECRRIWQKVVTAVNKSAKEFQDSAIKLVDILCEATGMKRQAGKGEEHEMAWGVMVDVSQLGLGKLPFVPIVLYSVLQLNEADLNSLTVLFNRLSYYSESFAIMIVKEAEEVKKLIDASIYAHNIVVLDESMLLEIFAAKHPVKILCAEILKQIDLTIVSPYGTVGPVSGNMYFGRISEERQVIRTISHDSITIVANRRVGKTSFLNHIAKKLEPNPDFVTFYFDLQYIFDYDEFYDALREQDKSKTFDKFLNQRPSPSPDDFYAFVTEIKQEHRNKHIVFIFDEVDDLLKYDVEHGEKLFHVFRSLSQREFARFLFVGTTTLINRIHHPDSPLFNFGEELPMGMLDEKAARALITKPMQLLQVEYENEEQIVERIIKISAYHPSIIQYLCKQLIEKINNKETHTRTIAQSDFDELINGTEFYNDISELIWGQVSHLEKAIIYGLWHTQPFEESHVLEWAQNFNLPDGAVKAALSAAQQHSILMKEGEKYPFTFQEFASLMEQKSNIELLAEQELKLAQQELEEDYVNL